MGRSVEREERAHDGGMISLARFIEEHCEAIQYDLLTKTGHEIDDIGSTLSWGALKSFVEKASPDSKISSEIEPELSSWATTAKTNAILADIFDMLAVINSNLKAIGSGKQAKSPEKYPRPKKDKKEKLFSSSMPMNDMRRWFERRRREHAGND